VVLGELCVNKYPNKFAMVFPYAILATPILSTEKMIVTVLLLTTSIDEGIIFSLSIKQSTTGEIVFKL
jgi:hypothetical protein